MYISTDVEIELEHVIEFIEDYASERDLKQIKEALKIAEGDNKPYIKIETRADQMKLEFLASIFHGYSLYDLQEKFKISNEPDEKQLPLNL